MYPFQRHRMRFVDNMPRRGGAMSGGCEECGGVCGGARNPKDLMDMVLQHVEDGHLTGGQVAKAILDYSGNGMCGQGFFGDLWHGLKKGFSAIAKPASMVLGMLPIPGANIASKALGIASNLAGGRKRRVGRPRKTVRRKVTKRSTRR
jgi:hypothetical protein